MSDDKDSQPDDEKLPDNVIEFPKKKTEGGRGLQKQSDEQEETTREIAIKISGLALKLSRRRRGE